MCLQSHILWNYRGIEDMIERQDQVIGIPPEWRKRMLLIGVAGLPFIEYRLRADEHQWHDLSRRVSLLPQDGLLRYCSGILQSFRAAR